ncbi:hypothetical protein WME98_49910 [Sorangium sp. So ce296]|uniref:hypothetical protein n=1 Tax=Sorangium sp. So ce296 TaxID=3133296 RepID=UPI003F5D9399
MKPKPIIPTEPPPPPPARAPEEPIPEDEPPPTVPPTQRPTPPPHAPSQRAGGRAKVRRIESPPEGTPVIIDRQRGSARAQAGIHSAGLAGVHLLG